MIQQTPRLNQPNFYWNSLAKGAGLRDKTLGFLTGNLLQETPHLEECQGGMEQFAMSFNAF